MSVKTTAASVLKKLRPSWWKGGIREITLFLVVYTAYSLTQDALPDRKLLAFHNTYNVIDFETRLKIFWELSIQSWFLRSDFLVQLVNCIIHSTVLSCPYQFRYLGLQIPSTTILDRTQCHFHFCRHSLSNLCFLPGSTPSFALQSGFC